MRRAIVDGHMKHGEDQQGSAKVSGDHTRIMVGQGVEEIVSQLHVARISATVAGFLDARGVQAKKDLPLSNSA